MRCARRSGGTHEYFEAFDLPAGRGGSSKYYDQLGSPTRSADRRQLAIERFVDEVEQVRVALGLARQFSCSVTRGAASRDGVSARAPGSDDGAHRPNMMRASPPTTPTARTLCGDGPEALPRSALRGDGKTAVRGTWRCSVPNPTEHMLGCRGRVARSRQERVQDMSTGHGMMLGPSELGFREEGTGPQRDSHDPVPALVIGASSTRTRPTWRDSKSSPRDATCSASTAAHGDVRRPADLHAGVIASGARRAMRQGTDAIVGLRRLRT